VPSNSGRKGPLIAALVVGVLIIAAVRFLTGSGGGDAADADDTASDRLAGPASPGAAAPL